MDYVTIERIIMFVQFFVYSFIYLLLVYYIYLMLSFKPFHPNLRCLLILMPPTVALSTTQYFTEFIASLWDIELSSKCQLFLHHVGTTALIVNSFSLLSLAGERLLAAIYVGKYEMFMGGKPILAILFFILCLIASIAMDLSILYTLMSRYIVYGLLLINIIFGTVFFLLLPRVTDQHYSEHNKNRFQLKVTVSEKYMQNENVKSARMMRILGPYLSISTLCLLIFFGYSFEHMSLSDPRRQLFLQIFYLVEPTVAIGIILIALLSHNRLRQHLFSIVRLNMKRSINIRLTQEEAEVYFTKIKEAWN